MVLTLLVAWDQSSAVKNCDLHNCPGVWPPQLEKATNRLMPLTLGFSNMFDSDPQEIHF